MSLVSDAMSRAPVTVFPDDDLTRARQLMERRRMRHLPVVQGSRLTQRDLLAALGPSPGDRAEVLRVRDVMVNDVVTATERQPLREAARILWQNKLGCLPVVDDARHVVGMLSGVDFIRFVAEAEG
jgi:CBS domain-containing protein